MFIAALFTIAKLWKQPRCPTSDEWIKKMWYLYTMEFYSTMKKNEILLFAGKWMELENIILSEVSQAQKTKKSYVLPHMQTLDLEQIQECVWGERVREGGVQKGEMTQTMYAHVK
jgi:hypothetical protein